MIFIKADGPPVRLCVSAALVCSIHSPVPFGNEFGVGTAGIARMCDLSLSRDSWIHCGSFCKLGFMHHSLRVLGVGLAWGLVTHGPGLVPFST